MISRAGSKTDTYQREIEERAEIKSFSSRRQRASFRQFDGCSGFSKSERLPFPFHLRLTCCPSPYLLGDPLFFLSLCVSLRHAHNERGRMESKRLHRPQETEQRLPKKGVDKQQLVPWTYLTLSSLRSGRAFSRRGARAVESPLPQLTEGGIVHRWSGSQTRCCSDRGM